MVAQNVETNEYLSNDLITDTEIEESETEDEQIDTEINTTEELQTDSINSGTEDTDLTEKKHYAWRASNVLVVIDDKAKVLNEEAIDHILNITFSVAEKTNESIMVVTTMIRLVKAARNLRMSILIMYCIRILQMKDLVKMDIYF